MEEIYNLIAARIKEQMTDVMFIDIDHGQIDQTNEYRPPIDYPAVLLSVNYTRCEDMGLNGEQACDVEITLRIVTQVWDATSFDTPEAIRQKSLYHHQLGNQLQQALHLWEPPGTNMGAMRRLRALSERRKDGLAVLAATYFCQYWDTLSAQTPNTPHPTPPDISMQ